MKSGRFGSKPPPTFFVVDYSRIAWQNTAFWPSGILLEKTEEHGILRSTACEVLAEL